jgi:hypothetical protein
MWNNTHSSQNLHLAANGLDPSGQANGPQSSTLRQHEGFQFGGPQSLAGDLPPSSNTGNISPDYVANANAFDGFGQGGNALENYAESNEEPFSHMIVEGPGSRRVPQVSRPQPGLRGSRSLPSDSAYGSQLYPLSHDGSSTIGHEAQHSNSNLSSTHLQPPNRMMSQRKSPSEIPSQPPAPIHTGPRSRGGKHICPQCAKELKCGSDLR